jgi:hypothetical protein
MKSEATLRLLTRLAACVYLKFELFQKVFLVLLHYQVLLFYTKNNGNFTTQSP